MGPVGREIHYEFRRVRTRQASGLVHNRLRANPVGRTPKKAWDSSYGPRGTRCGAWLRENALAMSIELDRLFLMRWGLSFGALCEASKYQPPQAVPAHAVACATPSESATGPQQPSPSTCASTAPATASNLYRAFARFLSNRLRQTTTDMSFARGKNFRHF
jgi:hypothetical protein